MAKPPYSHWSIIALRWPPSIGMWAPLMKLARGEARKATRAATSPGSQIRPNGMERAAFDTRGHLPVAGLDAILRLRLDIHCSSVRSSSRPPGELPAQVTKMSPPVADGAVLITQVGMHHTRLPV